MSTSTKFTMLLFTVVTVFGISVALGRQSQQVLHYEPAVVSLSGTLDVEEHFGAPGYGESPRTDRKVRIVVLLLDDPISVQGAVGAAINSTSYNDVTRVQLTYRSSLKLLDRRGDHVRATGTLFEKVTGNHYTDVLMSVQEVSSSVN